MSSNQIGDYELLELIGRGATGRVSRARNLITGDEVALKVLRGEYADDTQSRERFLNEGHLLADHDLPGVVRIREVISEGPEPAIVMDLVEGPTLRKVLLAEGALGLDRATRLIGLLGASLAAAHAAGLVHGDVKPENILVAAVGTERESTVLTDFGLARVLEDAAATHSRSQVIGTPHYAAPEIHAGGRLGAPSDVYALGAIAYEAVTGTRPFDAPTTVGIIQRHLNEEPQPTGQFSQPLWELVSSCLAKDPAVRPSAQAVVDSLKKLRDQGALIPDELLTEAWGKVAAPPTLGEDEGSIRRGGRGALLAGALVAVIAVGGGVAWAARPHGGDSDSTNAFGIGSTAVSPAPARTSNPNTPSTTSSATKSPTPGVPTTSRTSRDPGPGKNGGAGDAGGGSRGDAGGGAGPGKGQNSNPGDGQRPPPVTPTKTITVTPVPPPPTPTAAPSPPPTNRTITRRISCETKSGDSIWARFEILATPTHFKVQRVDYQFTTTDGRPMSIRLAVYQSGKAIAGKYGLDDQVSGRTYTPNYLPETQRGGRQTSLQVQLVPNGRSAAICSGGAALH